MKRVHFCILLILAANLTIWLLVLMRRLPYLEQIPVFDADVTTSAATMWARNWWLEGGRKIWFSLPYSPLSVETPTLEARRIYQSWPPGAFFPIYWLALLLRTEPTVPMVNWINAVSHGVIAVFLSFSAFLVCRLNRMGLVSSTGIALAVISPVLMQRGPVYAFSQIYCHTTHILVYVAAFIFLECLYHHYTEERQRNLIFACQLAVAFFAFLVDWLSFFVYGFWLLARLLGGRLGFLPSFGRRKALVAAALPFIAFGLYLFWRLATPGSMARTQSIWTSLGELVWKIKFRMGYADQNPLRQGFFPILAEMHTHYFSTLALPLIAASLIASVVLLSVALRLERADSGRRKVLFTDLYLLLLCVVPFYAQIVFFKQHSAIHTWAIVKIVIPFALLPFCFVPVAVIALMRTVEEKASWSPSRLPRLRTVSWVVSIVALGGLLVASDRIARKHANPFIIGRIQPQTFKMWEAVRRNSNYWDVAFSPSLNAEPTRVEVGVSNKLVYSATDFSAIDARVREICGPLNVLVIFKAEDDRKAFGGPVPSLITEDAGLVFLRYTNYPRARKGCP